MRMRARDVPQAAPGRRARARDRAHMTIMVLVVVTVLMTVAVLVAVFVIVAVLVIVAVARAAHAVHDIQHARVNALQHIDKYQTRVLAN